MIFIQKKTETEWIMTAKEAKSLAKELTYIAEEANDHGITYNSCLIVEGGKKTMDIKLKDFRIVALPDEEDENE